MVMDMTMLMYVVLAE